MKRLLCIAVALLLTTGQAHALGFGALELHSHLGERLDARVPLLLSQGEKMKQIRVDLASASEYRRLQLPRVHDLDLVRFEIHDRESSHPYIRLTSAVPIRAPLMQLLLKASKEGRGTYFRHFQLFLDPGEMPEIYDQKPTVIPLRKPEAAPTAAEEGDADGWARLWRYGPVRGGDSLSEIAYRLRRDKRFSNKQVMMALYEANPDSFTHGNINLLKRGAWLDVPRGEVIRRYGDVASMQRLSTLLKQGKPVTAEPAQSAPQSKSAVSQELKYSGQITMSERAQGAVDNRLMETVNLASLEKLNAIHEQMMSGQLQMTELGKSVADLDRSVSGMREEMQALKQDVKQLKQQAAQPSTSDQEPLWMIAVVALVTGLLGMLLGAFAQRRFKGQKEDVVHQRVTAKSNSPVKREETLDEQPVMQQQIDSIEARYGAASEVETEASQPPLTPETGSELELDSTGSIKAVEQALRSCDYQQAETALQKLGLQEPDSLHIAALKAQLYHETGRHEQRDELINAISESSEPQRWQDFCELLPGHVWNACFGDGTAPGNIE